MLCEGKTITRAELAFIHDSGEVSVIPSATNPSFSLKHSNGNFKTMAQIEAEAMQAVLDHYEQNVTKAADALGIAKSTFYRKLKENL